MPSSRWFLALFIAVLSLQLGLSMELPQVIWFGIAIALVGVLDLIKAERPTLGLLFVLFASGVFLGNQVLEDWAVEGSWPQNNGLGAGLLLSLLVYIGWLFLAQSKTVHNTDMMALNRDNQTIVVWGLLVMLMMSPPESTLLQLSAIQLAPLPIIAIVLSCLVMLADRCGNALVTRMLLLSPLLILVPAMQLLLAASQGPVIGALGDLFPRSSNFTPTGFSPNQQLRASVFLQPSNRAVMRIQADAPPNTYLAGNRLSVLDENLIWQPADRALQSLNAFEAELLDSGEYRYPIANHQVQSDTPFARELTIRSLTSDNYIFISPDTSHVIGRFGSMLRNAADVWTPTFERGADKRWQLQTDGPSTPDNVRQENLQLPDFWDNALQAKSAEFAADTEQQTVANVLAHFQAGNYALQTSFDPVQPFHDFFLNERDAYCFWFATGATLALRANGIPSRLVGGYVIHEQLASNLWLVRERDAHSWVEWQDQNGFWHTIDPTPPSIFGFFNGYRSSTASVWYHRLAGQWQILLDRLLANEFTANLIVWGGLLILAFLFVREYRRIRSANAMQTGSVRWQKMWLRFLSLSKLPEHRSWTATTYANNLPAEWPADWQQAAREFLHDYNYNRFASDETLAIQAVEDALEKCSRTFGKRASRDTRQTPQ